MYKKGLPIIITLLFIISLIGYLNAVSYKPGFSIQVFNRNLMLLSGVSLQLNLVDPYNGIIPVYAEMLSNGEAFIPINTKIRNIIHNWEEFYGQDFYYRIHPYLMFFITYVDKTEGEILYDAVSVKLSPTEISDVIKGDLRKRIIFIEGLNLDLEPIGDYIEDEESNNIKPSMICSSSQYGDIPEIRCDDKLGCPYVWRKSASDIWPDTGYGKIAVTYVEASPASWGTMSYLIFLETETKFNIGMAFNPFGSTKFEIGPALFSTSLYFTESFQIPYKNSEWRKKYIYINGIVEGSLYELGMLSYDDSGDCYYRPLNGYKYITSIVAVQYDGNMLVGGVENDEPPFLSMINEGFSLKSYGIYRGMNNVDGSYMITNIDILDKDITKKYDGFGLAIPLGAILANAGFTTIPISKMTSIIGSISTGVSTLTTSWYKFDSYNSYNIHVDFYVSQRVYRYSSANVDIPLMYLKISAYPSKDV